MPSIICTFHICKPLLNQTLQFRHYFHAQLYDGMDLLWDTFSFSEVKEAK